MKVLRLSAVLALTALGLLLAFYGLLALTFREGGGHTYVTIGGHREDAHAVGALSLVAGLVAFLCAGRLVRSRPRD